MSAESLRALQRRRELINADIGKAYSSVQNGDKEHLEEALQLLSDAIHALNEYGLAVREALMFPKQAVEDARDAARDVIAERQRQINEEDWTPEHDDMHGFGELASAAACYALATTGIKARRYWPWHSSGWIKPASNRRNLVKAGALILAEIERLDRAALSKPAQADDGAAK